MGSLIGKQGTSLLGGFKKVQARGPTQNLAVVIKCMENHKGFKVVGAKIQRVVWPRKLEDSRCEVWAADLVGPGELPGGDMVQNGLRGGARFHWTDLSRETPDSGDDRGCESRPTQENVQMEEKSFLGNHRRWDWTGERATVKDPGYKKSGHRGWWGDWIGLEKWWVDIVLGMFIWRKSAPWVRKPRGTAR